MRRQFLITDDSISFSTPDTPRGEAGDVVLYKQILGFLRELGFKVTKDPSIERDYPALSPMRDAGSHGELRFHSEYYPAGGRFEFYQDVVIENSSGGRYDFNKLEKMPYLIRLRWLYTRMKIREALLKLGIAEGFKKLKFVNPDPLAYFNAKCDGDYERRRGVHRFDRGPDGWPSDKELSSWDRKDGGGNIINHGDVRYYRDYRGRLKRAKVYGGINGVWMCVYGPGRSDIDHKHAREMFTCNPSEVPRKLHPGRARRLSDIMEAAVKSQDFEKAIIMRDLIRAQEVVL